VIRTSDSVAEICAALVAAQADMPAIPKATKGQVGNQTRFYADLSSVLEVVGPVLAKHKLGFVQFPHGGGQGPVTVITRLFHESGEFMECDASMPSGSNGAQGVGSAITYCKRYSLMAVLGLATEDDDGKAASAPQQQHRQQPRTAGVTEAQIRSMVTAFGERGIKARVDRLALISDVVGREVESSNDLTKAEANDVLKHLASIPVLPAADPQPEAVAS
jgi:hypothetical protein